MNKVNNIKEVNDIIDIVRGEKFIVIHRENGRIEVYNDAFQLLSAKDFPNVNKVNANRRVILIRSDGVVDFYDQWLNYEFSRHLGK